MPALTLGLAGDTMLGRLVADLLVEQPDARLVGDDVRAAAAEADVLVLNLECCISDRGEPWPDPGKPFFFRAPPHATGMLRDLGVDAVTLANNHALDFGADALHDTLAHLDTAGIAHVGAGPDVTAARRPAVLRHEGTRIAVVGATDHPADYAAGHDRPGVAFADLPCEEPTWLEDTVAATRRDADVVLATPHWGPNMTTQPVTHVRAAARRLVGAGATIVAGHSAHVFHGVGWTEGGVPVLYDLGDFLDDYAVDERLRNDLGVLWLVHLEDARPVEIEAIPLRLEYRHTRRAEGEDLRWVQRRLTDSCAALGTTVAATDDRLLIRPPAS